MMFVHYQFEALARDYLAGLTRRFERALEPFVAALDEWLADLFARGIPECWRTECGAFLDAEKAKGFLVSPESVRELEAWLDRWSRELRRRGALPVRRVPRRASGKITEAPAAHAPSHETSPAADEQKKLAEAELYNRILAAMLAAHQQQVLDLTDQEKYAYERYARDDLDRTLHGQPNLPPPSWWVEKNRAFQEGLRGQAAHAEMPAGSIRELAAPVARSGGATRDPAITSKDRRRILQPTGVGGVALHRRNAENSRRAWRPARRGQGGRGRRGRIRGRANRGLDLALQRRHGKRSRGVATRQALWRLAAETLRSGDARPAQSTASAR